LEDTVIIKEVHALHILEYNNLCNHLKDDDDVTRSTISHQGKNTPCQTFIPYTGEIGAKHDVDIFPTDPTKISKRSGTLLKRQERKTNLNNPTMSC
jgi:hypothetical protein